MAQSRSGSSLEEQEPYRRKSQKDSGLRNTSAAQEAKSAPHIRRAAAVSAAPWRLLHRAPHHYPLQAPTPNTAAPVTPTPVVSQHGKDGFSVKGCQCGVYLMNCAFAKCCDRCVGFLLSFPNDRGAKEAVRRP